MLNAFEAALKQKREAEAAAEAEPPTADVDAARELFSRICHLEDRKIAGAEAGRRAPNSIARELDELGDRFDRLPRATREAALASYPATPLA